MKKSIGSVLLVFVFLTVFASGVEARGQQNRMPLTSSPNDATPPVHFSVDDQQTHVYPCGLVEEVEFHRSFTIFFDRDGNETYTLERVSFKGVITNPTTGETFLDRGHSIVRFEPGFATGFTLNGIIFNIHAPREGLLLLDTGRLVVDADFNTVFKSGAILEPSETDDAVCAALQ
jgi:hypothetical protein